jgi:protein TonB
MTGPAFRARGARLALRLALVAAAIVTPSALSAQASETIYAGQDLDTPPKLANMSATARLISDAYPEQLKKAGISGTVQIQFIIGTNGKVEAGSVEIVAASLPALADAAKQVAEKIEFKPGEAKGQAVRARVVLPIVFKAR